jgi:hypothetical protein
MGARRFFLRAAQTIGRSDMGEFETTKGTLTKFALRTNLSCHYRKLDPSDRSRNRVLCRPMVEWLKQLAYALGSRLKSRARLEAENLVLRQQLNVLIRKLPKRLRLTNSDRLLLVWLYRLFPSILSAIRIVRPETVIRWHRRGFRAYWRWKSRPGVGRPPIAGEIRDLIRQMSMANPLWGAPRVHGELLMLGIDVAQSTVAKYMVPRSRRPSSQNWTTFLRNHAAGLLRSISSWCRPRFSNCSMVW